MKKLFVHHPLFRLLSPLFSGAFVYLLILLINNTVIDLGSNFFTQELYICIGLAYLIQESARLLIVFFNRLKRPRSFFLKSILHLLATLIISLLLVDLTMYVYFIVVLSYTPNSMELLIFNSMFSTIAVIYVLLYISNHFLYKINTEKLQNEKLERIKMEEDFADFKQDINPELLLESLEAILVLMKKDAEKAESLTENFASVYRYILSSKKKETVQIEEELSVLNNFIEVMNQLPYRKVEIRKQTIANTLLVPGSLLYVFEAIIKSTIPSKHENLQLNIEENDKVIHIKYLHEERLNKSLKINDLNYISRNYNLYSEIPVEIVHDDEIKTIKLPKLQLK